MPLAPEMKDRTDEVGSYKKTGRPKKISTVDDLRILPIIKKNPRTPVPEIRNTLQGKGSDYYLQNTLQSDLRRLYCKTQTASYKNRMANCKLAFS